MRILLWHGYLLAATSGSNVYTRAIAREWSRAGHEVVVFCQDPDPHRYDLGGAEVVRPELPQSLLPVFVLDRYEGLEARRLVDFTPAELEAYVEANARALREHLPADLVLANHALMGAPVARAAGIPFGVKVHGSELEYALRNRPDLATWARESLAAATATFVGTGHIRSALEEIVGRVEPVHEVPPGVDVEGFAPEPRPLALERLLAEARLDPPNPANADERLPDEGNAERFARFFASDEPTVLYFGKLLRNKGVHVLLDALRELGLRAVVVGLGDFRAELEAQAPARTLFTGPLEHRHLVHLVPLADVTVVPSIFPEAFGMVAAEAVAAGSLPLVARHSGLAEVANAIAAGFAADDRSLITFETGSATDLASKLRRLVELPAPARASLSAAARATVVARYSWPAVARRLLQPFE